jgi:hypothetical protein
MLCNLESVIAHIPCKGASPQTPLFNGFHEKWQYININIHHNHYPLKLPFCTGPILQNYIPPLPSVASPGASLKLYICPLPPWDSSELCSRQPQPRVSLVTGWMCSDRSGSIRRLAGCNYGGCHGTNLYVMGLLNVGRNKGHSEIRIVAKQRVAQSRGYYIYYSSLLQADEWV